MQKAAVVTLIASLLIAAAGCREASVRPASNVLKPTATASALKSQAERTILLQLNDTSAYQRCHAIEVAVETGQRQMMSQILERLKDTSVAVRFAAAVAVGEMQCIACEKELLAALKDENLNVRIAAAYSLVRLGNSDYKQEIYNAMESRDENVRANAILLIGKLGDPSDRELLYGVLHDERATEKLRFQAVESLARLGDIQMYRNKLWPMQISKYADDRVMGIRGMGALGNYESQIAIQTMLKDDVPEVRLVAAEQLGRLRDYSGRDEVINYFNTVPDLSQPTMANQMAVLAIGRIGGPELERYLGEALNSPSQLIQLAGAQSVLLLTR